MTYRTVTFSWLPRTGSLWASFTASRREAARLWGDLVERHKRIRRARLKWPTESRWRRWAKGRYPGLHSQSVQEIIGEFCDAIHSTTALHRNGHPDARFPFREFLYRDIPYTNQAVRLRGNTLIFPNGKSGDLRVRLPNGVDLPGRLMEARIRYGEVVLVCEVPDPPPVGGPTIGVDLGVNTLIAATDGETAVCVSGREVKATVQWRNKRLASLQQKIGNCHRGSRRWGRLQRRKHKLLRKSKNKIKDLTHKATRKVAETFPGATCYVGKAFNEAASNLAPRWAQQVSSACNGRLTRQLGYKTSGATVVPEPYTSQTCPVCGVRNRCGRLYTCRGCGYEAPRDVVGAVNIRGIGLEGTMVPGCPVPNRIHWVRPTKVCRPQPASSRGHRASSSSRKGREASPN